MVVAPEKRRFTADQFLRMAQVGILCEDDRLELIDGEIVEISPIGLPHRAAVACATRALIMAVGDGAIVQPQGAVRLDLYYEPEPDLVLLKPRSDFYRSRRPDPADVLTLIEVADSSLEYDRDVKAPIYAEAAIPEYWLVDLSASVLWRYLAPGRGVFQSVEQFRRGQSLAPRLLPACVVAVDAFFPE
jgi:Uma2 family endonuclease